ncbi:MAG: 3-dehydroquinate synthase [Spirochaetia bacterium]|nr:3-dehydroquinate synthase [Spirochaetia bacterium]
MLHVFDRNTSALFPRLPEGSVVLAPGEDSKNWAGAEAILSAAFDRGMARDSLFIAVGGGMVCDLTAFAASVFMRGARLRLLPTTLLAMVDASFGGKTAINFGGCKNLVGTFYPAESITLSTAFLRSLPRRELLCGLAEIVKYAMLGDAVLYEDLRKRGEGFFPPEGGLGDEAFLLDVLWRTLEVKARFVREDPEEQGPRAYLNLGHTFGHGLEAATGFGRFTHGEAVAWGMMRALRAGRRLGITGERYAQEATAFLKALGFPEKVRGVLAADILRAMEKDKKKKQGEIRFVLQRGPCDNLTQSLDPAFVAEIVEDGLECNV